MRRLLLLRHAKAERLQPGERDHDRRLAERGREDALQAGAYLSRHGDMPDQVIVSPATRTRETWELVAAGLTPQPPVVFEPRVYDASPETLLAIVQETAPGVRTLMMVGHNPGLHDLATHLIGTGDVDTRQSLREAFPTCGLAIVEFAFDRWNRLHAQAGRLERFVTPRSIAAATD